MIAMPTGAVSREEGPAIVEKIWDNPRELELKTRTVSLEDENVRHRPG